MVVLIAGGTHTGKTVLAQKLLETYQYPYLSIDHLKMGLIRSGYCRLSPESDNEDLTAYIWPVVSGIIKTAVENKQNLIIEGCYIPFDYRRDFEREYLEHIKYVCLIFSRGYIEAHFADILRNENAVENRLDSGNGSLTVSALLSENEHNLKMCKQYRCDYILIEDVYSVDFRL